MSDAASDNIGDAARQLRKALGISQDFDDWPLEKLMQKAAERIAARGEKVCSFCGDVGIGPCVDVQSASRCLNLLAATPKLRARREWADPQPSDTPGAWTCKACGFRGFWSGGPHCSGGVTGMANG